MKRIQSVTPYRPCYHLTPRYGQVVRPFFLGLKRCGQLAQVET
jgi:hypothetical protein